MSSAASTPCAPALHGNTRYPVLRDKEALEALVVQFGTPSRIAKHLGCSKSTASYAMRRLWVKPRNFVADERVLAALGVG
ncbi:MAG: hypothetical protein KBS37_05105 [Methanocorpusculum sp.]|nr:hypothetical protein [Candidatus Methanocorpusculum equi]